MKRNIIVLIVVLIGNLAIAKIPGTPKNLLSPNAASLGQYGDIPVSLYTGTPNIEIPFYEIKYGEITVPISLSYHASGIRPDQHPGWVGLGWTLNAGGMISRNIKQLADDYCIYYSNNTIGAKDGYYFNNNILNGDDWSTTKLFDIAENKNDQYTYIESEADEFSFNFLGYSGKFYWDAKGFWRVQCDKPVKVMLTNDFSEMPTLQNIVRVNHPRHFSGFTIIDEYGNKYIFGVGDDIEYSTDFFSQKTSNWNASSWMLNKIVLVNGEEIKFKYERGPFINQLYSSLTAELGMSNSEHLSWFQKIYTPGSESFEASGLNIQYGGQLISPVYLKSIITPNDSILFSHSYTKELKFDETQYYKHENVFVYNSSTAPDMTYLKTAYNADYPYYDGINCLNNLQWQQLDKIFIFNKMNSFNKIKSYELFYSSSFKQRLTLNSILEKTNGDEKEKEYHFEYYNINKMPQYISNKIDHWGYYNGKFSLVAPASFNADQYYLNREASTNVDTISVGTLRKIYYPTGGTTEFIYEPHDYQKQLNINRWDAVENTNKTTAGGLRISRIISNPNIGDSVQKTVVKEYIYKRGYNVNNTSLESSGVLGGRIKYLFLDYKVKAYNAGYVTFSKNTFSSQSVLPACENSGGSHIGYSEVVEKLADNSYTKYTFTNFDNGYKDQKYVNTIHENLSPYQPYNSKELERGKMLTKSIYNSSGILKSKKTIAYKAFGSDTSYVKVVHAYNATAEKESSIRFADGSAFKIYTYPYLPVSETDSIYEGGAIPIISTNKMDYNQNNLLSLTKTINSVGDTILTHYKYSGDCMLNGNVTPSAQDELFSVFNWMKENNMLAYPVEQYSGKKKAGVTEKEWIYSANLSLYSKIKPQNALFYFPVLSSEYKLDTPQPILATDFKNINLQLSTTNNVCDYDNRYIEKMRYNNYDAHGNPIYVTKNGIDKTVYLWSYNYRYPIAEIINASLDDVANKGEFTYLKIYELGKKKLPESSDWQSINNLITKLPESIINKYDFKPLVGIDQKVDQRGVETNFIYDKFNRLASIRDKDYNIISAYNYKYTDFEISHHSEEQNNSLYGRIFISGNIIKNVSKKITIGVVGGSEDYSYQWTIKNSSGVIIMTTDSSSPTLTFVPDSLGYFTIQCRVIDTVTQKIYVAEKNYTVSQ